MRISRLELDGIGPFENAVFEIPAPKKGTTGELVLFEGPNGCGKTTILEGIAVLIGAAGNRFSTDVWPSSPGEATPQEHEKLKYHDPGPLGTASLISSLHRRVTSEEPRFALSLAEDGSVVLQAKRRLVEWHGGLGALFQLGDLGLCAKVGRPTGWAAFALRVAQSTVNLATDGPKQIDHPILRGALSFSEVCPASAELGQILVNIYFDHLQSWNSAEQAKGTLAEVEPRSAASARKASLERFESALSSVLGRKVKIEFAPRQRPPVIRFDGKVIPLDLLGEGLGHTLAWFSDLVARLELTPWKDTSRSPFEQDFWLLLDEVDQSLHPSMQLRILPSLRSLFPNARIYATTRSPFVVASAGEGCVFSLRPDEKTHLVIGETKPK